MFLDVRLENQRNFISVEDKKRGLTVKKTKNILVEVVTDPSCLGKGVNFLMNYYNYFIKKF